jgi:hypothetical protein
LAHTKLFGTLQQLKGMAASVPLELYKALALLHSYVLVKSLIGLGDHLGAARMLVRVAGNISKYELRGSLFNNVKGCTLPATRRFCQSQSMPQLLHVHVRMPQQCKTFD